jgi:hypothetical protein
VWSRRAFRTTSPNGATIVRTSSCQEEDRRFYLDLLRAKCDQHGVVVLGRRPTCIASAACAPTVTAADASPSGQAATTRASPRAPDGACRCTRQSVEPATECNEAMPRLSRAYTVRW